MLSSSNLAFFRKKTYLEYEAEALVPGMEAEAWEPDDMAYEEGAGDGVRQHLHI